MQYSSFSSTLLEAIYRSIDDEAAEPELMFRAVDNPPSSVSSSSMKKNSNKKQGGARSNCSKREEIEKWMEKRTASTGFHDSFRHPRTAPPDKKTSANPITGRSSCGKVSSSHHYCSLEKHQTVNGGVLKSKSTNSGYQIDHKLPLGGGGGGGTSGRSNSSHFVKTKSHALRFYRELKKMKHPISPGGRLAALINSIFLTGHSKKEKFLHEQQHQEAAAAQSANGNSNVVKSNCSSASSFSRSCLSHKTSSSSASSAHKAVRSVRFSSPDTTVLVEDRKPVKADGSCDDIQALLRKYQNEDLFAIYDKFAYEGDDDDDDDEISSCGSSDLFELDHLIGPGGMEELPVYETTRLDANRPIANSLFV